MSLVAWDTISQPMLEGGLGILSFLKHAQLLKLLCVSQLIESHPIEWVRMAEDLICFELGQGPLKRELRFWSPSEALLLQPDVHTGSRIVNSILASWKLVARNLCFQASRDFFLLIFLCINCLD